MKTYAKARFSAVRKYCFGLTIAGLIVGAAPSLWAVTFADFLNDFYGKTPGQNAPVSDYRVISTGGMSIDSNFKLYQSATFIDGNVAEGPHTILGHNIDATVSGRWDYDNTDANPCSVGCTGTVSGGFHQVNLSPLVAAARKATNDLFGLTATQTFASLQEGQVIQDLANGLNVIDITGNSTIKTSLTLQGNANSIFVFRFLSKTAAGSPVLTLSGMTMNIGNIDPNNIFWAFQGKGGDINITSMASGQHVYGTFLAPERNLTADHAIVVGRLIAGGSGSLLNIHSGSQILSQP